MGWSFRMPLSGYFGEAPLPFLYLFINFKQNQKYLHGAEQGNVESNMIISRLDILSDG